MTGDNNEHPPSEQRLNTESEIIQLFNKLRLEEKQATEALYETHDLPLEITESCEGLSRQDSIEFARRFKKKQPKFYHENITIGEQLNKNYSGWKNGSNVFVSQL